MSQVNFRTESATYERFKLICMIKKQPVHENISSMIKDYVEKNADLLDNPKIKQQLAPELPSFFGDLRDWGVYINRSNANGIKNFAHRITALRYLLHNYIINNDKDAEIYKSLMMNNSFSKSSDADFIRKTGIIGALNLMRRENNPSNIKILPIIKNL